MKKSPWYSATQPNTRRGPTELLPISRFEMASALCGARETEVGRIYRHGSRLPLRLLIDERVLRNGEEEHGTCDRGGPQRSGQ
jgi:hypothetical protein